MDKTAGMIHPPVEVNADWEERNRRAAFVGHGFPSNWLSLADELKDAAEILWTQESDTLRVELLQSDTHVLEELQASGISRPYFLLAGFAVENVLKGLLIVEDPSLINEGRLKKRLISHKLAQLVTFVPGLVLEEQERRFCEIASWAIPFWGRYPVPVDAKGLMPEVSLTPALRTAFLNLFNRLHRRLYYSIRDGWKANAFGAEEFQVRYARYEGERSQPSSKEAQQP